VNNVARNTPQSIGDVTDRIGLTQMAEKHAHQMCPTVNALAELVALVSSDYFRE